MLIAYCLQFVQSIELADKNGRNFLAKLSFQVYKLAFGRLKFLIELVSASQCQKSAQKNWYLSVLNTKVLKITVFFQNFPNADNLWIISKNLITESLWADNLRKTTVIVKLKLRKKLRCPIKNDSKRGRNVRDERLR